MLTNTYNKQYVLYLCSRGKQVELSIASSQKDKQLVLFPDISVSLLFQMLAINIFSHHDYIF